MTFYGAGVIGRAHRRQGRGGQDAWAARPLAGGGAVLAVADGCSAGRANEIGAGVGARAAVVSVARRVANGTALATLPAIVVADVVEEVGRLARALALDAQDAAQCIEEALLFTLHVAAIHDGRCVVFGVGDGVIFIDGIDDGIHHGIHHGINDGTNDRVVVVDQGPAPDYPAYALFAAEAIAPPRVLTHYAGAAPRALALCTDGANELIARAHESLGDGTAVGGVETFLRDERYLKNASLAQKRLQAWVDVTGGPVDDCTLVVWRSPTGASGASSAPRRDT
jgi:hypothetical protein